MGACHKLGLKWKVLAGRILKHADRLLTVSEFTKQRLVELLGADEKRIVVIGKGVEDLYFERATPLAVDLVRQRPYALVVGGLSVRKGGDIVLAVAKLLAERWPDIVIIVAGRSEPELAAAAFELKNVNFVGYVDDRTLHSLLAHSICLLFPSRYEGFGIPAAEAMAAGAPVIVSTHPALAEVVGEVGFVGRTPEEMACQIARLERAPDHRAQLGELGRARARQFTWAACANRLINTFHGKI